MQKRDRLSVIPSFSQKPGSLFGSLDRSFSEILHQLADVERMLAGAGAGSFVALDGLQIGVQLELSDLSIDFFNEFFHGSFWFCNYIDVCKKLSYNLITKLGSFS